ncbi:hypothetical protein [Stieleria maiorica]|uniref:hypothetical protein n=1 Tax=Stieleria maiorica TaxID=2795974 RepID=UPI0011C7D225|nr:hypothetical protein [Stieleria maiorica]
MTVAQRIEYVELAGAAIAVWGWKDCRQRKSTEGWQKDSVQIKDLPVKKENAGGNEHLRFQK